VKGYRFLGEALEYEDAVVYYEKLRPGLGASFILDFDQSIVIAGNRLPRARLHRPR
jgi:hypothetical protein